MSGKQEVTANETVESNPGGWFFLKDGTVDFSYTGLAQNENGIFWMKAGGFDTEMTGVVPDTIGVTKDGSGWLYLHGGIFDANADTIAANEAGWWKIRNGLVDFSYALMFITIPKVFASMGLGTVVGVLFFLLVLFAAVTSSMGYQS